MDRGELRGDGAGSEPGYRPLGGLRRHGPQPTDESRSGASPTPGDAPGCDGMKSGGWTAPPRGADGKLARRPFVGSRRKCGHSWEDPGMAHVLSGRAETPTQSRILTFVRDEGPLSRMDLAARLNVSRTTVAAEVGRLVELGLAEDGGPAASRGGRRSTLVDLDSGLALHRRRARCDLDADRDDRWPAGRDRPGVDTPRRHPTGSRDGPRRGHRARPQAAGRPRCRATGRDRRRRARAGRLPGRRAGLAADHARVGRLPRAGRARPGSWAAPCSSTTTST